jgi:acylphosphatase
MADSSASRERIVVHGHVQGIFFRDSVRARAEREGVCGWVRNRPDGTVEAVFEGPPERIARLVAFCEQGPRGARVDLLEHFDEEAEGLTGFQVR